MFWQIVFAFLCSKTVNVLKKKKKKNLSTEFPKNLLEILWNIRLSNKEPCMRSLVVFRTPLCTPVVIIKIRQIARWKKKEKTLTAIRFGMAKINLDIELLKLSVADLSIDRKKK